MALMDEFKEERATLKQQPFKKKWEWFWGYYKLHVLAVVICVLIISNLIYNFITQQEQVFYVGLINCAYSTDTEAYDTAIDEYLGVNTSEEYTVYDTSMSLDENFSDYDSVQKFALRLASNELDAYISEESMFYNYAVQEIFVDLETILTPELYEYYKDDFFYFDQALLTDGTYDLENVHYTVADIMETFDSTDPDSMQDPIAIGIYIKGTEEFYDNYYIYSDETVPLVFGIISSCYHQETAIAYLEYITQ
ncbi:MAG: hypothetical protein R3Y47_08310 [Lachnospiraceae bacterium]